ncbi:MAG TPA: glycosyl hydrolase, partial [Candidatus Sulfotelmatobacter sp.]
RGLNRANWPMRLKAPAVAPAATALGAATEGPRVLPGTYTVKMTKGDHVYSEQLNVVLDPRAKYTVEDRKAQFELEMKVYRQIEHMTYAVSAIEGVRNAAYDRAGKMGAKDKLRGQLQDLSAKCDELRSKIVATKEGGMVTGEERIRELLGQLYGDIDDYDGRPTDDQAARSESLGHELDDVVADFNKATEGVLPAINAGLKKKKLEAITVLPEEDWRKKREAESGMSSGAAMQAAAGRWERD